MGLLGGILSGGLGFVGNLLTQALGTVFSGLSQIPGVLLGFARNLFTTLFNTLTGGFRAIVAGLGVVVQGLVSSFQSAISAAKEFSQAALQLRAGTGASYAQAGSLLTRGLAFGRSASETANIYKDQNPLLASMRGNNYQSRSYFGDLSREYNGYINGGPMSLMAGRAMLRARGVSDDDLTIAAMNPRKVAAQEAWSNSISGKLGMKPGDIQLYAEDFQLGFAKIGTLFELLKLKLASAIGPQLVRGLEKVGAFLTRNADRITRVLEHVGGALSGVFLRGLETVLGILDNNSSSIEGFIRSSFDWLLKTAPPLFMRAGAFIGRAFAALLNIFATGTQFLINQAPFLSTFFNNLTAGFIANIPSILQAGDFLLNGLRRLVIGIYNLVRMIPGLNPVNPSGSGNPPAGSGNNPQGQTGTSPNTPANNTNAQNPPEDPGFWGGMWPRVGGALLGAWAGAEAGVAAGAAGGGAIGGLVGLMFGGVGSVPGAAIGAGVGGLGVGLAGALAGAWAGWNATSYTQQMLGAPPAPGGPTYNIPSGGIPGMFRTAFDPNNNQINGVTIPVSNMAGDPGLQGFLRNAATAGNGAIQNGLVNLQNHGPEAALAAANGAKWLGVQMDGLDKSADNWLETLKNIDRNTNATANNTKDALAANKDNMNYMGNMLDVLSRVLNYDYHDQALAIVR